MDILLLLAVNALVCGVFYGVVASTSSLFERTYSFLDEMKIGLCFLAVGGGMTLGSCVNGKLLDKWYHAEKVRFAEKQSDDLKKVDLESIDKLPNFPLERVGSCYPRIRSPRM